MKNFIAVLVLFQLALISIVSAEVGLIDVNLVTQEDLIPSDFSQTFLESDLTNFKKLRKYLASKQRLKDQYSFNLDNHIHFQRENERAIKRRLREIANIQESIKSFAGKSRDEDDFFGSVLSVDELNKRISENQSLNRRDSIQNEKLNLSMEILKRSILNLEEDIDQTQITIDHALAPEYSKQKFRSSITLYFSALIGVMISLFFIIIFFKAKGDIAKTLLSENGLQFITIFVLIISVILFGVLEILQATELAAILSAISGYILGKTGRLEKKPPSPPTGE